MVFVPDLENSGINPELKIPGWEIVKIYNEEKAEEYRTNFGETAKRENLTFSHYRFGLKIQRPISFCLLKIIPPIIITLLCCMLVFLLDASYVDARIGTPVAVLLTEVFLYLSFTNSLPNVGTMMLLDYIFNFSYLIIFLIILVGIWTTSLLRKKEALEEELEYKKKGKKKLQEEVDLLESKISRIDRCALILFPTVLSIGIFGIILSVRGWEFFQML